MASPEVHNEYGPSYSHIYLECTNAVPLGRLVTQKLGVEPAGEAAELGTRVHSVCEAKVRYEYWQADGMNAEKHSKMTQLQRDAYPGINKTMYEAIIKEVGEIPLDCQQASDTYCDVVMDKYLKAKELDPATALMLETRVHFDKWIPGGFGTSDCIIVSDHMLEVCDYKNGTGVPVDAKGNPQMRIYALGAIQMLGSVYDFDTVRMTIIQPRLNSITEDTMSLNDLLKWGDEVLAPKVKESMEGRGSYNPSEETCRFCKARRLCSARWISVLEPLTDLAKGPGLVPDEQINAIMPILDHVVAWVHDIKSYTESQALKGQKWRGWKLVKGRKGNRKFTDEDAVKDALLTAGYGEQEIEVTKLKPLGDIEKTIGKQAFKALLTDFVTQPDGKLALVQESDPREEVGCPDTEFADMI